jgi:hypothetical protein
MQCLFFQINIFSICNKFVTILHEFPNLKKHYKLFACNLLKYELRLKGHEEKRLENTALIFHGKSQVNIISINTVFLFFLTTKNES